MTGADLTTARFTLARLWGLSEDEPLSLSMMGEVLGLAGKDVGSSVRHYERGKTAITGPLELAVEALLSGWRPARLSPLIESWARAAALELERQP